MSTAPIAQGPIDVNVRALTGHEPHPDYAGWAGFLQTLEVRDSHDGVTYYGTANCNYLLFPTGEVLENFGYHGVRVMREVREFGWETPLAEAKQRLNRLRAMLCRKH